MTDARRMHLLTSLCAINLLGLAVLVLTAFAKPTHLTATTVDAERVNIVGTDGKPLMILAGRAQIPGPFVDGQELPRSVADGRELLSGIIFLNEQGDEVGGLLFNGIRKPDGGYSAVGHLSFDQWKQNQVVALQYIDGGKSRRAGLTVWDRPTDVPFKIALDRIARMQKASGAAHDSLARESSEARARGEEGVPRIFLGSQDRAAQLVLRDTKGRVRVRLVADSTDTAHLDFLDESGAVVSRVPEKH